MKYPALGLFTLFLRALADTTDKLNSGELENQPVNPAETSAEPATDKPKTTRTRRTKEQIAADEAAAKMTTEEKEAVLAVTGPAVEREETKAPAEELAKLYPDKSDKDLYQERRASFIEYIKAGSAAVERVKNIAAKYNPSQGNRGISREDHAAFLADIEALKL